MKTASNVRWLFIGPPGVGKGTYASRVAAQLNIPHISSGDLLRQAISSDDTHPNSIQIKNLIDKGLFVPNETVQVLVDTQIRKWRSTNPSSAGYILDGFPRTVEQATEVDNLNLIQIDHVISLRQPYSVILAKMSSRRSCGSCGMVYNFARINEAGIKMEPLVPSVAGTCDKCGSTAELLVRPDDELSVVSKRLKVYEEVTAPLEDFYLKTGKLTHFDVLGGASTYLPKLRDTLNGVAQKIV